jgi:hypothetical protein
VRWGGCGWSGGCSPSACLLHCVAAWKWFANSRLGNYWKFVRAGLKPSTYVRSMAARTIANKSIAN